MQLLLRVRPTDGAARDLRVEVDPETRVSTLAAELAAAVSPHPGGAEPPGLFREATGVRIDPHLAVGASGLVSGEALLVGVQGSRPSDRRHPEAEPPPGRLTLEVLAGPEAGRSLVLTPGHHLVGRDPAAAISIDDPAMARRQLVIDVRVDGRAIIAVEPGTPTEVVVDGRPLAGPAELGNESAVQAGTTLMAIRKLTPARSEPQDRLGSIPFHRTPYRPSQVTERSFEPLGDIPTRPEPRRLPLLGSLAPLAGGLALYAFSRQPQFLALTALTPLTMAASWIEERRSGGRRFDRESARFRTELANRRKEVDAAVQAERVERMRAAPDTIELARRAALRTVDLWARGRGGGDFLDLRLGLGEVDSKVRAPVGGQGDAELRREAVEALAGHRRMASVPIVVPMTRVGTMAVLGGEELVQRVAASAILQAAVMHSPEDLIVLGALAPGRGLADQVKWLPHTRSLNSPLATPHVVCTQAAALALCTQLVAVAERRIAEAGDQTDRRWPWLLFVLDESLDLNASVVARLLERAPGAGISVLWLGRSAARVPRQASAVLRCVPGPDGPSELWFRDPGSPLVTLELEPLQPDVADRAMRALAPMRDASSVAVTSAIPRVVPLFSALGIDEAHRSAGAEERLSRGIVERWLADPGYSLEAPFGLTADGSMRIDLVADGPHVLIGGTSGSGKSELLVALVAGLISRHPPTRLNLLFVDYKGGAASSVFRGAPHTVGYVTNLNGDLANRALVSLRAELNRRMRLLEGRAKDLGGMLAEYADIAPPSLVIVVDEFATLVKEVPDFVPGIVDIAQRGRSLGIHLVLATQRPSGAVNENILANTNARICLRMIEAAESAAIIGTPDAASIPVPLRGRGFARLGPGQLTAFQAAYGAAPVDDGGSARIRVADFTPGAAHPGGPLGGAGVDLGSGARPTTQLDALLAAVGQAAETLRLPVPRPPWLDELPGVIRLEVVLRGFQSPPGRWRVPIGEFDDPKRQRQDTVAVDLEEGGGLLVYGAGGSGKTTVLRTIAGAVLAAPPPEGVAIFGLDFASRALRALQPLGECAGIATGDDLEAVTRVLALLEREIARRRSLLAGAESLSAHLAAGGSALPRVLLLVDGYTAMRDVFTGEGATAEMHGWLDRFHRLAIEGRQAGLHAVITADRPAGVAPVLVSAIARRLILRQVDERALVELGVPATRARGLELGPGRGFLDADLLVQVACLTGAGGTDGAAQSVRLAQLAGAPGAARRVAGRVAAELRSSALRETENLGSVPFSGESRGRLAAVLGVADVTGAPVVVDLEVGSLVVAGPSRSGRSTALMALLHGWHETGAEVYIAGPAASPLRRLDLWCPAAYGDPGDIPAMGAELAQMAMSYPEVPRVLVLDDADRLLENPEVCATLDPLARCDAVRIVAAVETASLVTGYFQSALMQQVKKMRRRLLLQPLDGAEIQTVLGVRFALRPGLEMPPGRGVLLAGGAPVVVQVGTRDRLRDANPEAAGVAPRGAKASAM